MVLEEEELSASSLLNAIQKLFNVKDAYIDAMKHSSQVDSVQTILNLIQKVSK